jgi:hypothetical protein
MEFGTRSHFPHSCKWTSTDLIQFSLNTAILLTSFVMVCSDWYLGVSVVVIIALLITWLARQNIDEFFPVCQQV